ncbi:MAG: LemA family protein [Synergistaceae bacterium]|nr:LemA family protein [Synergistaceae bacterium]
MQSLNMGWLIFIGLAALATLYVIFAYNGLARGRNQAVEAWSDVDTQLKRRYDLIPNLVETVRGYAKHESSTLERVVTARNAAMGQNGGPEHHAAAETILTRSLRSVFALSEAYPDLKANQNFVELQRELTDTEDKIQASRRFYNSVALPFNNRVETFPSVLIANLFGFRKFSFFELDESEKAEASRPVRVQF